MLCFLRGVVTAVFRLINEPDIILADEPTGDLDVDSERDIMNLLEKLNRTKNITIILVTHNPALAEKAHRQFTMLDGKLYAAHHVQ